MKKNSVGYVIGLSLIILGTLWLVGNLFPGLTNFWSLAWPIFVLIPGLFFWALWKNSANPKRDWGLIIPSAILITYALVFFFNMFVSVFLNYDAIWGWTAFMYIAGVAIAFWLSWTVTGAKMLLTVAKILSIISLAVFVIVGGSITLFSLLSEELASKAWPIILIVIGLLIVFIPLLWQRFWQEGRFLGKSEEEWRKWGEGIGKEMEKQGKDLEKVTKKNNYNG